MGDDDLRLESFRHLVGEKFAVDGGPEPIDFTLVEATPLTGRPEGADGDDNFSLIFGGPLDRPLDQQIVHLRHQELGDISLFVVPVSETAGQRQYQAIVNRVDRVAPSSSMD